jgi:tetratricopeptide (TPR) repeat protein
MTEIDAALVLDPDWAEAHHLAARIAASQGNMARTEQEIEVALRLAPDDLDIRATKAAVLAWRFPFEALHQFDAILERSADHIYAHGQRARILVTQLADPRAAIPDLNFILSGDSPATEYLPLRAQAYLMLGRAHDAVADYNAALKLDPGRLYLVLGRAAALAESGDDRAALADYDTVLGTIGESRRPYAICCDQLSRALMERAAVLIRIKRFSDAAADMSAAITNGGRPAVLRAELYLRQHGFPQVQLDGRDSPALRAAVEACFALDSCSRAFLLAI